MPPKVPLSEERVVDSSDSDVDSDTGPSPAKPTIQQKQKNKSKSDSAVSTTKLSSKSLVSSKLSFENEEASDSDASRSSVSDGSRTSPSTSTSTHKRPATSLQHKSNEPARKKQKLDSLDKVTRVEPRPYFPPSGYTTIPSTPSSYATEISHIFDDTQQHNKQIWHITAPASVDLSTIKQFVLSDVLAGRPLLEQDGVAYGLHPRLEDKEVLLLPDYASTQYKQSSALIRRSLYLREVIRSDKADKTSSRKKDTHGDTVMTDMADEQTPSVGVAVKSDSPAPVFFATVTGQNAPPRLQPAGLRSRWIPYGAAPPPSVFSVPASTSEMRDPHMTNGISLPPATDDLDDPTAIQPIIVENSPGQNQKRGAQKKIVETVPGTDVMDVIQETSGREKITSTSRHDQQQQQQQMEEERKKEKRKKKKPKVVDSD